MLKTSVTAAHPGRTAVTQLAQLLFQQGKNTFGCRGLVPFTLGIINNNIGGRSVGLQLNLVTGTALLII